MIEWGLLRVKTIVMIGTKKNGEGPPIRFEPGDSRKGTTRHRPWHRTANVLE